MVIKLKTLQCICFLYILNIYLNFRKTCQKSVINSLISAFYISCKKITQILFPRCRIMKWNQIKYEINKTVKDFFQKLNVNVLIEEMRATIAMTVRFSFSQSCVLCALMYWQRITRWKWERGQDKTLTRLFLIPPYGTRDCQNLKIIAANLGANAKGFEKYFITICQILI